MYIQILMYIRIPLRSQPRCHSGGTSEAEGLRG